MGKIHTTVQIANICSILKNRLIGKDEGKHANLRLQETRMSLKNATEVTVHSDNKTCIFLYKSPSLSASGANI